MEEQVAVDPTGRAGPTPGQARGPTWRRVSPNRYVPSWVDVDLVEQRIVEMASYLPAGGAITGWASLRASGAAYFDGRTGWPPRPLPVPIAAGATSGRRAHAGIQLSYEMLSGTDVETRHGVPMTTPARALFDAMRRPGIGREAVVALDMALAAGVVSGQEIRDYHASHTRWRRSPFVATALMLGNGRSRSPTETRLRLVWVLDAGLPTPRVNREVFDLDGDLVCVADLFDEEAGLVVEYDGAEHRAAARHAKDVRREEKCRDLGLEYCKVTGPDLTDRRLVVRRLHGARRRALFLPPGQRRWTLEYPPGWSPWW